jgi:hypothetical protein
MSAAQKQSVFLATPNQYFTEMVDAGFEKRNLKIAPHAKVYLVSILEHYLDARNLFTYPDTLAEAFLLASNAPPQEKIELLKKTGDKSLYISGFFGDSLYRKVIDIEYYAGMGGAAYAALADCVRENQLAEVYRIFSERFSDFVEVLTFVSNQSIATSDQGLLKLYDRYMRTGSESAKEKLIELGVLTLPKDQAKLGQQD